MTTLLRAAVQASGPPRLAGEALAPGAPPRVYLLLNKPPGFITTVADERGRPTVIDLVPPALRATGLHPPPASSSSPTTATSPIASRTRSTRSRRSTGSPSPRPRPTTSSPPCAAA